MTRRRTCWIRAATITIVAAIVLVLSQAADRVPSAAARGVSLGGPVFVDANRKSFTVASFNIHSGVGVDGKFDLERTARALAGFDFAGLNEVRGPGVLGGADQAELLGRRSGRGWLFAPAERQWWRDHFGNGVLTNLTVQEWQCVPLAGTRGKGYRNYVRTTLLVHGQSVAAIVTHVDRTVDRAAQLEHVVDVFLGLPPGPAILMGDLNSTANDPQIRRLCASPGVVDCVGASGGAGAERIDWIFARNLKCLNAGLRDDGTSDHPLVFAEFAVDVRSPGARSPGFSR